MKSLTILLLAQLLPALHAQGPITYRVSTYAGVQRSALDALPGTQLTLDAPRGVARDSKGNIYFSDFGNHVIRKMTPDGKAAVIAGTGIAGYSGNGGPALAARIQTPRALALDGDRALYFVENDIRRIRRIDLTTGIISAVAGDGTSGFNGDGRLGTDSNFASEILGLAVDRDGGLLITDSQNHRLRKLSATDQRMTTIAGTGAAGLAGDTAGTPNAPINMPSAVVVHPNGDIYFEEFVNRRIRRISNGQMSTVVGGATATLATGAAAQVSAGNCIGMAFDPTGNELYWSDEASDTVRKVNLTTLTVTLVAGAGVSGFSGDAGPAAQARLSNPNSLVIEPDLGVLIGDQGNHRLRRVAANGTITTIAGGFVPYAGDGGLASAAIMSSPLGLKTNAADDLIVSERGNCTIRVIDTAGRIQNLAGAIGSCSIPVLWTGMRDDSGNVFYSAASGISVKTPNAAAGSVRYSIAAKDFSYGPRSQSFLTIDSSQTEAQIRLVRRADLLSTSSVIPTLLLGSGLGAGGDGGPLIAPVLFIPSSVAFNADESAYYVLDPGNRNIRLVKNFVLSTFRSADSLATARYLAVEPSGAVWVTNTNYVVRYAADGKSFTHVIGDVGPGYTATGHDGSLARFSNLNGIAVRGDGTVYMADTDNHVIRKLTPVAISSVSAVTGAQPSGLPANTFLARVRLMGADGAPVTGFTVNFTAPAGVTLSAPTGDTDLDGIASVSVTLPATGTVTAAIDGLPPVTIPLSSAPQPAIASVIASGAFGAAKRIAPGGWVEIYGSNLAKASQQWAGSDFQNNFGPVTLAGVRVQIDGKPGFLQLVSPGQINCVAPDGLTPGDVTVTVQTPDGLSAAFHITAAPRAPALLAPPQFQSGAKQYVVALFADQTFVGPDGLIDGAPFRRAAPGDRVLLYGINFGATTPAIPAGQIAGQAATLPNVVIRIGGVPAVVEYAGVAGNFVGLYQFNLVVPDGVTGDSPLTLEVDGIPLPQQLLIAIR